MATHCAGVDIRFSDAVQQPYDGVLLDLAAGAAADGRGHLLSGAVNSAGLRLAQRGHRPQCARARPVPRWLQGLACLGLALLPRLVRCPACLPCDNSGIAAEILFSRGIVAPDHCAQECAASA